jgi:GTP-binding protein
MDRVIGEARAGNGGKGNVSFGHGSGKSKRKVGSPDGGNGGDGGDVIIKASSSKNTLDMNSFTWNAKSGTNGAGKKLNGRKGADFVVHVPCGTVVRVTPRVDVGFKHYYNSLTFSQFFHDDDRASNTATKSIRCSEEDRKLENGEFDEKFVEDGFVEVEDEEDVGMKEFHGMVREYDLIHENDFVIVAKGGKAGIGNAIHKSIPSTTRQRMIPGGDGAVAKVELELKCIADVGLVGFPNAGKSSLATAISSISPKVAAYPFTTMMPYIGVVRLTKKKKLHKSIRKGLEKKFSIADIPGIIKGAHEGRGLGLNFLRHIERTKVLLYVIDIVGEDEDRDPVVDFMTLENELQMYHNRARSVLSEKPAMILANKTDIDPEKAIANAQRLAEVTNFPIYMGSAKDPETLQKLVLDLFKLVEESRIPLESVDEDGDDADELELAFDAAEKLAQVEYLEESPEESNLEENQEKILII